jgi:hypothetical protein
VLRLTEKLFEAGVDMVAIADTVGMPGRSRSANDGGRGEDRGLQADLHSPARHRGMASRMRPPRSMPGARVLDGSLGGPRRLPVAPGATGNVVFEDLVFLCESKGFATGIDIEKLVAVRGILKSEMPGEALYGGMARAGLPGGDGEGGVINFSSWPGFPAIHSFFRRYVESGCPGQPGMTTIAGSLYCYSLSPAAAARCRRRSRRTAPSPRRR